MISLEIRRHGFTQEITGWLYILLTEEHQTVKCVERKAREAVFEMLSKWAPAPQPTEPRSRSRASSAISPNVKRLQRFQSPILFGEKRTLRRDYVEEAEERCSERRIRPPFWTQIQPPFWKETATVGDTCPIQLLDIAALHLAHFYLHFVNRHDKSRREKLTLWPHCKYLINYYLIHKNKGVGSIFRARGSIFSDCLSS